MADTLIQYATFLEHRERRQQAIADRASRQAAIDDAETLDEQDDTPDDVAAIAMRLPTPT